MLGLYVMLIPSRLTDPINPKDQNTLMATHANHYVLSKLGVILLQFNLETHYPAGEVGFYTGIKSLPHLLKLADTDYPNTQKNLHDQLPRV